MVEAKLLRKKLKNGLIVDKWDLVTIIEKQQTEIASLQKNLDVALMIVNEPAKTLTDEEILEIGNAVTNLIDSNEGWIEFARAILKKAQEK
jgi:hypothetical protein